MLFLHLIRARCARTRVNQRERGLQAELRGTRVQIAPFRTHTSIPTLLKHPSCGARRVTTCDQTASDSRGSELTNTHKEY